MTMLCLYFPQKQTFYCRLYTTDVRPSLKQAIQPLCATALLRRGARPQHAQFTIRNVLVGQRAITRDILGRNVRI